MCHQSEKTTKRSVEEVPLQAQTKVAGFQQDFKIEQNSAN